MRCQAIISTMVDFVKIKIATLDEVSEFQKLRENIFVKEEHVPYQAEFDGNDLSATHLLACIGDKPVGTMRIRYFGGFVKFERACVIPELRKTNVAKLLMDTASKFCAAKGFEKARWFCQKELVSRWAKMGAYEVDDVPPSAQHGMTLVTMEFKLPKTQEKIDIKTSPETLNRKEGEWFNNMPIFGSFTLHTKERIAHFKDLSEKIKSLKATDDTTTDKTPQGEHSFLKQDNIQTR